MVKRYGLVERAWVDSPVIEHEYGPWVTHHDYLLMVSALKEALEGWMGCGVEEEQERIEEIRSHFDLTDK